MISGSMVISITALNALLRITAAFLREVLFLNELHVKILFVTPLIIPNTRKDSSSIEIY